jgi:hypothetical protein
LELFFVDFVAYSEPFAAFCTTAVKYIPAPTVFHAVHETVFIGAFAIMRLVGSLHRKANIENF